MSDLLDRLEAHDDRKCYSCNGQGWVVGGDMTALEQIQCINCYGTGIAVGDIDVLLREAINEIKRLRDALTIIASDEMPFGNESPVEYGIRIAKEALSNDYLEEKK